MAEGVNPKVSVIIATYNRAEYIGKAITSVISQIFTDWELIIWNDGSTDDTETIVGSFSDQRIKYFADSNHGKCYALNKAIGKASGRWIAILDDDDLWKPNKLQLQTSIMASHSYIAVFFANFNNNNLVTGEKGVGFLQNKEAMDILTLEEKQSGFYVVVDNLLSALLYSNFILPSSTLIQKDVFELVGTFNEELRNGEDLELWWRIYLNGFTFGFTNDILVERIKPTGSLSSPSVQTYQNHLAALELCYQHSKEAQRNDLLPKFRRPFRYSWQGLIRQYGFMGERRKAIKAFISSCHFGLDLRSMLLTIRAILGLKVMKQRVKQEI